MDSPLLSPGTETCGTSETCGPPPLDPNETNRIVQVNKNEQQYWKNPSIYRVPAYITNLNPKAHQPQVVSFGPYHHDKDHLHPMEEHKHRALSHFLEQSRKSHETFLKSLRKVAQHLKESYSALDPKWKEDLFLELMLRDGCFMLEIMRTTVGDKGGYASNDPIFSIHRLNYIKPYIKRDMLILENQLPMLVLYQLVTVENNGNERDEYINELITRFYSLHTSVKLTGRRLHVLDVFREGLLMEPEKDQHEMEIVGPEAGEEGDIYRKCIRGVGHVVDVFRKCLPMKTKGPEAGEVIIRSATKLSEFGIRFTKSHTHGCLDIFFARGALMLPTISVDDTTETKYLNIMTFERLHIGARTEVTSYVAFMDSIINNEQDVALLQAQCIIKNGMGSDKAAADLFNSLCKEVTLPFNGRLHDVQKDISTYCKKPWNRQRANLKHTYFRSPWAVLSLIAAITLFALTIIQTVYAVLSYY